MKMKRKKSHSHTQWIGFRFDFCCVENTFFFYLNIKFELANFLDSLSFTLYRASIQSHDLFDACYRRMFCQLPYHCKSTTAAHHHVNYHLCVILQTLKPRKCRLNAAMKATFCSIHDETVKLIRRQNRYWFIYLNSFWTKTECTLFTENYGNASLASISMIEM